MSISERTLSGGPSALKALRWTLVLLLLVCAVPVAVVAGAFLLALLGVGALLWVMVSTYL